MKHEDEGNGRPRADRRYPFRLSLYLWRKGYTVKYFRTQRSASMNEEKKNFKIVDSSW